MKQGGLLDEGISPITICHTHVSSNEMFAERLLFVAARLDDAALLPPPTIRSLHKSRPQHRCRLDAAAMAHDGGPQQSAFQKCREKKCFFYYF